MLDCVRDYNHQFLSNCVYCKMVKICNCQDHYILTNLLTWNDVNKMGKDISNKIECLGGG